MTIWMDWKASIELASELNWMYVCSRKLYRKGKISNKNNNWQHDKCIVQKMLTQWREIDHKRKTSWPWSSGKLFPSSSPTCWNILASLNLTVLPSQRTRLDDAYSFSVVLCYVSTIDFVFTLPPNPYCLQSCCVCSIVLSLFHVKNILLVLL